MNIWLVKLEESLPIDQNYRPYRMGMLADALIQRKHHVTRWVSDRIHLTGQNRFGCDKTIQYGSNQVFEILNSGIEYKKPLSPMRLLDNFYLTYKFKKIARSREKPDLIVCAMPTPELAKASSQLGQCFNVPVVIDARDYWPDIFEQELVGLKKILAWPIVKLMKYNLNFATNKATSLIGITDFYRDYLLRYANRKCIEGMDGVFPLGYSVALNVLSDSEVLESKTYWEELLGKGWYNKKIIYFAGRLNSTVFKAIDPVISLVKKAENLLPDYVFVFCGSGQYEDEIKSSFDGLSNVVTPGEVSARNLSYLRSNAYLALQPIENRVDYLNSLSNKFFEYLSSGLPIITSLRGITEDAIKRNEIGFVYSDAEQLSDFMGQLYYNEALRNEMAERAKQLFDNEYSSDIVYRKFAEHCEKVVKVYQNHV